MSTDQHLLAEVLTLSPRDRVVLDYLQDRLPGYPFDADVDRPFVAEFHNDFPHLDVLEQIKVFRWYHETSHPSNEGHGSPSGNGSGELTMKDRRSPVERQAPGNRPHTNASENETGRVIGTGTQHGGLHWVRQAGGVDLR